MLPQNEPGSIQPPLLILLQRTGINGKPHVNKRRLRPLTSSLLGPKHAILRGLHEPPRNPVCRHNPCNSNHPSKTTRLRPTNLATPILDNAANPNPRPTSPNVAAANNAACPENRPNASIQGETRLRSRVTSANPTLPRPHSPIPRAQSWPVPALIILQESAITHSEPSSPRTQGWGLVG